jgi:hypothetical protein
MGVDEIWRARIDAPHSKSYLAFVLGFHELVERVDGPPPVLWMGPVDLDSVPRLQRAYWANWNPVLQAFEAQMRSDVDGQLSAILRPGLTCDHPAVRPLADTMLEGHRAALLAEDAVGTRRSAPVLARYPIKPIWAFVFFVKVKFRHATPTASENALNTKVAEYLSQGIPRGQSRQYAITRNHVDRAAKRFLESLRGRVNSNHTLESRDRVIQATFLMWDKRLAAIEEIARAAAAEQAFRGKTGTDLVTAIDRSYGAHRTYYRVLDGEHVKRRA